MHFNGRFTGDMAVRRSPTKAFGLRSRFLFAATVGVLAVEAADFASPQVRTDADRSATALNVGLKRLGTLRPKDVREVGPSNFTVTLDPKAAPNESVETRGIPIEWAGPPLRDPVWVDLVTGWVYELPADRQIVHSCGIDFVEIPVYDSPCVLTERRAVDFVESAQGERR